ncbi:MAG TPA: adenylate/guanylate cyclase domain-containing protein, partial [Sporichthyaceae bacterium]
MSACRSCEHDNPATAKFCLECGTALVATCPDCATPATPGQKFCGECGRNLGLPPTVTAAPKESERKQVTVLFADVARSMELAERLEADEWTQLMQRVFAICRDAVTAYGGTVDKFTGDGVMALFGAPVALEDHARRACHAARRIVEGTLDLGTEMHTRGVELAIRVGLNSGEVVAGSVGGDAGAYTAVGHTVGLAQRMEAQAEPGTVCLSEHTAALIRGGFGLRDLGRVEIKGATLPVGVFALGAPAVESRAGARRSGSTRLVGRDNELADLVMSLTR